MNPSDKLELIRLSPCRHCLISLQGPLSEVDNVHADKLEVSLDFSHSELVLNQLSDDRI